MLTEGHIDEMTVKWLSQTPSPPRIPEFYTLTKIHKPTLVGRPIISGCDDPTERISCLVDRLIQPIAQQQESYLKDAKDFINFIENTKLPKNTILASMDVTSLYTNIPEEEGDTKVYKGERFNRDSTLDVQTNYKQTETFQDTDFYSCHPPGVKKRFIKGEALRLLRTNSSHSTFNKNIESFKTRLKNRGYPNGFLEKYLFEVNFKDRKRSLENKEKSTKKNCLL